MKNRFTFLVGIACWALVTTSLQADSLRLQSDFSFKRVTVPSKNTNRRITVQIDPTAPSAPSAPLAAGTAGAAATPNVPKVTGLEWFWWPSRPKCPTAGRVG